MSRLSLIIKSGFLTDRKRFKLWHNQLAINVCCYDTNTRNFSSHVSSVFSSQLVREFSPGVRNFLVGKKKKLFKSCALRIWEKSSSWRTFGRNPSKTNQFHVNNKLETPSWSADTSDFSFFSYTSRLELLSRPANQNSFIKSEKALKIISNLNQSAEECKNFYFRRTRATSSTTRGVMACSARFSPLSHIHPSPSRLPPNISNIFLFFAAHSHGLELYLQIIWFALAPTFRSLEILCDQELLIQIPSQFPKPALFVFTVNRDAN